MALSLSITDDIIMAALRAFLITCVPVGVEVFQTQINRVPQPPGSNFVTMTQVMRTRMATNTNNWAQANPAAVSMDRGHSSQLTIQIDVYGPSAYDNAFIIATLFRDQYAADMLQPSGIAPLFATDGTQAPFIDGEKQYENRWTMRVAIGASPIVSTVQDFAATLAATVNRVN